MGTLATIENVLSGAGFELVNKESPFGPSLIFENENCVGLAHFFETSDNLIAHWEALESWFLSAHVTSLRRAPRKAWNAYTALVSGTGPTAEEQLQFDGIEQNFRATRKIARSAIDDPSSVADALLPLLPLQYDYQVVRKEIQERLAHRIPLLGAAKEILLSERPDANELANLLLGEK